MHTRFRKTWEMENGICKHITGNLKSSLYDYRYPGTNSGLSKIKFNKLGSYYCITI